MTAVGNATAAPKTVQQNESLRAWTDANADRLGAGEAARAKVVLREHRRYLKRGAPGAVVRIRSLVVLALGLGAMLFYSVQTATAIQAVPTSEIAAFGAKRIDIAFGVMPWVLIPAAVLFVAIALVSVRIPTPLRVIGGIVGILAALWMLVLTLVMFANAFKADAAPALLALAAAVVVLLVGWAIGARR